MGRPKIPTDVAHERRGPRLLNKWGVVLARAYGIAATVYAFAAMCGDLRSYA